MSAAALITRNPRPNDEDIDAAATAIPSFGAAYTDAEIAAVAHYAIVHFGGKQGRLTAKDVADARP